MVDARRVAMWDGRALKEWERRAIGSWAAGDFGRTRTELARRVCEEMNWRRPNGKLKVVECRHLLELLAGAPRTS